jgi:hypothetical protein
MSEGKDIQESVHPLHVQNLQNETNMSIEIEANT